MLDIYVLGAAAGGGFPQWNCASSPCQKARDGVPTARRRTQASIAVSGDSHSWYVLNASPDLRQQIQDTPALWPDPQAGLRNTPIKGVILTNAEIDAVTGLLSMRERQPFKLYGTHQTLGEIDSNPIFKALDQKIVERVPLICGRDNTLIPSTLQLKAFTAPGKCPLYAEDPKDPARIMQNGENIGLEISDGTSKLLFIPNCAEITDDIKERIRGADILFFDGTLWKDRELIEAGLSYKTGRRMGHMSLSEKNTGTFDNFRHIPVGRKIFIHINNSNPILLDDSLEYIKTRKEGWEVAYDGMHITL